MFRFDVYFEILNLSITLIRKKSTNCDAVMVSYTPQFKHNNLQKASSDFAEWCWILYVPM